MYYVILFAFSFFSQGLLSREYTKSDELLGTVYQIVHIHDTVTTFKNSSFKNLL